MFRTCLRFVSIHCSCQFSLVNLQSLFRFVQRNKKKAANKKAAQKKKNNAQTKKNDEKDDNDRGDTVTHQCGKHNLSHHHNCENNSKMDIKGKLISYFTSTIITTFYATFAYFASMYVVIKLGLFDSAFTENGLEFYAEKAHPKLKEFFPTLDMPLNTIVNIGYVNVGLVIVAHTQKLLMNKKLKDSDAAMFFIFGWSAFLYGHVQFWRILLQRQHESVMDQWITLPIFAWTVAWTIHLFYDWSLVTNIVIIMLSTVSYCLTWYSKIGFEIALGWHIIAGLISGGTLYWRIPLRKVRRTFWITLLMCSGFVILKLLDLQLPAYHEMFYTVSGHFLSKICDFLMIYFTAQFFLHCNMTINKYNLRASKTKND